MAINQQPSPQLKKSSHVGSYEPTKMVSAQLSKAFLSQRQNNTPNPVPSSQPLYLTGPNNSYHHNLSKRNLPVSTEKHQSNALQVNLLGQTHGSQGPSGYLEAAAPPHGLKYAQNMNSGELPGSGPGTGSKPRSTNQFQVAGGGAHTLIQIKNQKGVHRNGQISLTNRQKPSQQQLAQQNTLYSQISLREINSPLKQYQGAGSGEKLSVQRIMAGNFYGQSQMPGPHALKSKQYSAKYLNQQQLVGFNSNSSPALMQLHPHASQGYLSEVKDLNQLVEMPKQGDETCQVRSRNMPNVTTNGATTSSNGTAHVAANQPGPQILNINTASDINIYNNSFIVNTSPSHGQNQIKISAAKQQASSGRRATNKGGSHPSSQTQRTTGQAGARSHSKTGQGSGPNSMGSTGRMQKPSSQRNLTSRQGGGKRLNAISEAYNGKQSYVVNNQLLPTPSSHLSVPQPQVQSQRELSQPLRGTQASALGGNQGAYQQMKQRAGIGAQGKNCSSTEHIRRADESMTSNVEHSARNSSFSKPQFNNLVNQSGQRIVFAAESNLIPSTKRGFKNGKKNKEQGFQTQPLKERVLMVSTQADKSNQFARSKAAVEQRVSELVWQGRRLIQQKKYAEAESKFTEVLEKVDHECCEALFYRAIAFLDQGNLQQAIGELRSVVNLHTSTRELCQQAYILLSIAHKRLGEVANAIQDLERCISLYPDYAEAYLARGQILLHQEEFKRALLDFRQVTQLKPEELSGLLGIGDCHKALREFAQAREAYDKAIKLLPMLAQKTNHSQIKMECYMKRGLACYHDGQHAQALADFLAVVHSDNTNVKAHFYIGKLLAKGVENSTSKQSDAILHFEQVAKYPDQEFYYGNAMFQIAKLRLKQKDYYQAFYCLKRASDNNFQSKRLTMYKDFTEGVLYLVKRKIKKGVQILSDLLEILLNKEKEEKKETDKEGEGKHSARGKADAGEARPRGKAEKVHADFLIHQILLFRAYGYVAIEKYEMAQEDVKKVAQYGKVDAATIYNKWLGKGILRMDHEDYLMASKFFSKACKKFPGNKDPYCLQVISIVRSYTYSLGGYFIDQSIKFNKVLETKKFMDKAIMNCCHVQKEPSLYFFRGLLNFQLHHFYEALADFNAAIDAEEESTAQFFLARGRTYACLSILPEAMKDLSVALNLDETLQQGYIYRGKCAYLIGDNNLAFLDFQRLILTDPKNPMVHVYAGNLLMTTGAYHDAIKAYENADSVEPTAVSAFQRVRCHCALQDLDSAAPLVAAALKIHPEDDILKYDGHCIGHLIETSNAVRRLNEPGVQPGTIKSCNEALHAAILAMTELIQTFESNRLLDLKRRDALMNIQLIPNVERIKLEKAMIARDVREKRLQLPPEQAAELPDIPVDPDEPVNVHALGRLSEINYYYENVFNLEDFYLFRGVCKFYRQEYAEAAVDFQNAHLIFQEVQDEEEGAATPSEQRTIGRRSGVNTRNHSLQHYSSSSRRPEGSKNSSVQSNGRPSIRDVGISSFCEAEIVFNQLLAHLLAKDKAASLAKLDELTRKMPSKYTKQLPVLRALVFQAFKESDKAKQELQRLKQLDPSLHEAAFGGAGKQSFTLRLFPSQGRLCERFLPVAFRTQEKSLLRQSTHQFLLGLSFSMPFVKPPNMIPSVDEEAIQTEFNLKQIDAPMPEAPWIKRCAHGITFTDNIQDDQMSQAQREKYRLLFDTSASKTEEKMGATTESTVLSAGGRLLENMVAETVSDRHKLSLMEETSRIVDESEECKEAVCRDQLAYQKMIIEDQDDHANDDESYGSYDSEEVMDKDGAPLAQAMALRQSSNLNPADRESLVNFGENYAKDNLRELRKIKKELVEPAIEISPEAQILPKMDQQPRSNVRPRYGVPDDDIEEISASQHDEKVGRSSQQPSARKQNLVISQQSDKRKTDPHGLKGRMLGGEAILKKAKERRVSNLSIGDGTDGCQGADEVREEVPRRIKNQRGSQFRSSIDQDQ